MEDEFTKTIERLIHEILSEAINHDLKYEDFVAAVISAYKYRPKKMIYAKLISKIETLLGVIHEFSNKYPKLEVNTDELMKNLISVRRTVAKAYLIDDLGLPEIYSLTKNFGYLNLSIKVVINKVGNTQTFKNVFGVNYMVELARILGAQLITKQDYYIHETFSQWFSYDELLKTMDKLLNRRLLELIKSGPAIIIADHGYDIEHVAGYYRLCHGYGCQKPLLSLICPLMFISG
jgi:hypothetical protein